MGSTEACRAFKIELYSYRDSVGSYGALHSF